MTTGDGRGNPATLFLTLPSCTQQSSILSKDTRFELVIINALFGLDIQLPF